MVAKKVGNTAVKKKPAIAKSTTAKPKKTAAKKKATPVKKTTKAVAKKKVSYIPKGYHHITPYFIVDGAKEAIAFYKKIFGAKEIFKMQRTDGKIGHAELMIQDTKLMLADECPEMQVHGPRNISAPIFMHIYVKDVDAVIKKAVSAGATLSRPAENMFYGDRGAAIIDPLGHHWFIATHIEEVPPAELKKRAAAQYDKK